MYAVTVSRRDEDGSALGAYLREIAKLPRLTADEERALGTRIQGDRDEAAMARLVEANLRFVVSYAKRYRGHGVSFLDLIHEGNLGLIEAAHRFDPSHNVKFITYAVWWVRESMMHVLADQTRAFSFPPKLFASLHAGADVSLNEPVQRESHDSRERGDLLPQDQVPVEEVMIHQADLDELTAALGDLDGKEREVVRLRFGLEDDEPRTLQEIGDRLHLTRERVRQIETRAKEKLRRSAKLRSRLN
jgi:RNA polymerase primary sigma factor